MAAAPPLPPDRFPLVFGIHNHQPVGNFDHVVRDVYECSYLPFLERLERHPHVRIALHLTGCLLDFLRPTQPEYIRRLRALADQGRIEFLTGGYYEPILPVIPEADRIGQIEKLSGEIERLFGQRPVGAWLAERVWEPHLPSSLARAGVKYCVLDQTHFRCSGLSEDECFGHYGTEDLGHAVTLFPILERLRYTIPFDKPAATIDFLRAASKTLAGSGFAVFADDGEKFGAWPGTHKHCYTGERGGWLDRFFEVLGEVRDEFPMITFSEAMERTPSLGRVYLPTASYFEMMEWAQPARAVTGLERAVEIVREKRIDAEVGPYLRGGFWRNFISKYPEVNQMYQRMIDLSGEIAGGLEADAGSRDLLAARDFLRRAQCNCAWWHGVFGGLYLAHLRHAVQCNLNAAARLARKRKFSGGKSKRAEVATGDCLRTGGEQARIESANIEMLVSPGDGGAALALVWKPRDLNLADTLSRRPEAYHERIRKLVEEHGRRAASAPAGAKKKPEDRKSEEKIESIHGELKTREKGLEKRLGSLLIYDEYRRAFGVDHVWPGGAGRAAFERGELTAADPVRLRSYKMKAGSSGPRAVVDLEREAAAGAWLVERRWELPGGGDGVRLAARITNRAEKSARASFAIELNVNLLAGDAHDRMIRVEGRRDAGARLNASRTVADVRSFAAVDQWLDVAMTVTPSRPVTLWQTPIRTVSISEAGLESIHQGCSLVCVLAVRLAPGESEELDLEIGFGPAG